MKRLPLLLFVFVFTLFTAQAQINHVEPLNWWVGMKNPALQLLINGTNIGETTPSINYPGVTIQKIHKADSKNYIFLDLLISKTTKPGSFTITFKKNNKTVETYKYNLFKREEGAAATKGFNSSDVIYLITPDRFANGDETNDIVTGLRENKVDRSKPGGRHGGDIRGIIDHLDYISEMGFTAIWPQPMLENDMASYSYHGYSITDRYKTDPRFGSIDEYKELSSKAKQKGIKLIFDDVINHIGSNYWWMNDKPFHNWLNYQDSLQLTTHHRTTNQDPYASKYDKALMTKGWFVTSMPDMNGENPFMANYLIQSSIWWIETLHLGGIRQDTYPYSDKKLLTKWTCSIMNEYPDFSIVGEEWSLNPIITSYWQRGMKNRDGFTNCLQSVMDFPLHASLIKSLTEKGDQYNTKGLITLYEALANDFIYPSPDDILIFGDNHDMDRLFTQLNNDVDLVQMALTYLLTIRGIPQIYYGTEILAENTASPGNHGIIRSDFPGGWKNDKVNAFTGEGLSADQSNIQSYLKQLLNWRKKNPVIANGKTLHFAPFNGIYVYFRYTSDKTIMVVMNRNEKAITLDLKNFEEILENKKTATNILTKEQFKIQSGITVKAKSATVFEMN